MAAPAPAQRPRPAAAPAAAASAPAAPAPAQPPQRAGARAGAAAAGRPAREPDERTLEVAEDPALAEAVRELAEKSAKPGRYYAIAPMKPEDRARCVKAVDGVAGVKVGVEGEGRNRRVVFTPDKPAPLPKRTAIPDDGRRRGRASTRRMGKPKSLKDKLCGAAVLKMSFRLRGDEDSPAFRVVYPGVLRDLGARGRRGGEVHRGEPRGRGARRPRHRTAGGVATAPAWPRAEGAGAGRSSARLGAEPGCRRRTSAWSGAPGPSAGCPSDDDVEASTIAAVATAPAAGGVGILRVSGPAALRVGRRAGSRRARRPRAAARVLHRLHRRLGRGAGRGAVPLLPGAALLHRRGRGGAPGPRQPAAAGAAAARVCSGGRGAAGASPASSPGARSSTAGWTSRAPRRWRTSSRRERGGGARGGGAGARRALGEGARAVRAPLRGRCTRTSRACSTSPTRRRARTRGAARAAAPLLRARRMALLAQAGRGRLLRRARGWRCSAR